MKPPKTKTKSLPRKRGTRRASPDPVREDSPPYRVNGSTPVDPLRFIDLFCGIGGFRIAFERIFTQCVVG
jgi:hypothetical protein